MGDVKMETFLPPYLRNNTLVKALRDTYTSFSERRQALGLSNPGTVENVNREVTKDVFLNNFMFSGLRADINRPLSVSPLFQYSHSFAMGSQGLPPYGFSAIYGSPSVCNPERWQVEYTDIVGSGFCKAISTMMDNLAQD